MFRLKGILWVIVAFLVPTGSCEFFYKKPGDEVKMTCNDLPSKPDIEWKMNDNLLIHKSKSGSPRKSTLITAARASITDRTTLRISSLVSQDAGVYTCRSTRHILSVVSAQANPSTVLYNSETKLRCDLASGSSEVKTKFQWFKPTAIQQKTPDSNNKEVTIKSATSDDAGTWTCKVTDEKGSSLINVNVEVEVAGPLKTSGEVRVSEGGAVELLCVLPGKSRPPINGGLWKSPSGVQFPELIRRSNTVKWNRTGVSNRVHFSDQELKANFSVILQKVTQADAGDYVCTLEFEGGKSLSEHLTLKVLKGEGVNSDNDSTISKISIWHKRFWGMQMWIWVAISASAVVLIVLVITIVLINRRNKRMKRKMNKLNSLRHPRKKYCECTRTVGQPKAVGHAKKARPPPLPRHEYSSLHEL